MAQNRYTRRTRGGRDEPKLGRMLLFSLLVHAVLVLVFSGSLAPRPVKKDRPAYFVDLVNLPVESPQAGRPEAKAKAKPKKAPEKVEAKKAEPVVKTPPKKTPPKKIPAKKIPAKKIPAKKIPAKKIPAKVEPKKAPPKKVPAKEAAPVVKTPPKETASEPAADYEDTLSAIAALKRKQERENLKEELARLAQEEEDRPVRLEEPPVSPVAEAPVGMPEGRGREVGVEQGAYLETFIKSNWSFSLYQLSPGKDPASVEARVRLVYDAEGRLIDYKIEDESGESSFDESIKKAILKSKKMPRSPGRRLEVIASFNLKEMLEADR